jgi:hypothetical protein
MAPARVTDPLRAGIFHFNYALPPEGRIDVAFDPINLLLISRRLCQVFRQAGAVLHSIESHESIVGQPDLVASANPTLYTKAVEFPWAG